MTDRNKPYNAADSATSEWSEQCMLYLLGDMPDRQREAFEQQLEHAPHLADQLLAYAQCVDEVSRLAVIAPASSTSITPPVVTPHTRSLHSTVAIVVAMAACLAWFLVNLRPSNENVPGSGLANGAPSEALLIAKVWADEILVTGELEPHALDSELLDSEWLALGSELPALAGDDAVAAFVDEADTDATLSWMVAAVAAESDTPSTGEAHANEG